MRKGMELTDLIEEVRRQAAIKVDYLASTKESIRMTEMEDMPKGLAIILLKDGADRLERFSLTENAHRQIAAWLEIPWKYYDRLVEDHTDLIVTQVNALFEREPGTRMMRTMDGKCRAFMSDKYRRLDNDLILSHTLPRIVRNEQHGVPANKVLANHITDDEMRVRVVFTGDELAQDIGTTRDGKVDIVRPGFEVFNSETGKGSFKFNGFFHRGYCDNGAIWKMGDFELAFERRHVGGKLQAVDFQIFSDDTRRKDDEALMAQIGDLMAAIGSKAFSDKLGDQLRAAKAGTRIVNPTVAVQTLAKEIGLRDSEVDRVLENLLSEGDLSRYGALNAVTAVANRDDVTEERSFDLQELGASLMTMKLQTWDRIAVAA